MKASELKLIINKFVKLDQKIDDQKKGLDSAEFLTAARQEFATWKEEIEKAKKA